MENIDGLYYFLLSFKVVESEDTICEKYHPNFSRRLYFQIDYAVSVTNTLSESLFLLLLHLSEIYPIK